MELITKDDPFMLKLTEGSKRAITILNTLKKNHKPVLNGEIYMTDQEVSEKLKVSRRTLQDYRNAKKIPYIILGGKVLYKESDIGRMLENGYSRVYFNK